MNHYFGKSASFQIGANFELLSHPLQVGIRFFPVPLPSRPSSALRFSTLLGEPVGLTLFPGPAIVVTLGSAYTPVVLCPFVEELNYSPRPAHIPFGSSVKPVITGYQPFSLVGNNEAYGCSP